MVSLSEYDQSLRENVVINRMHESLSLFANIITSPYLANVPTILFFSKDDIFREKIQSTSLRVCFPEYPGKDEYKEARDYIIDKFLACTTDKISHLIVGNLTDILFMVDVVSFIKGSALYSWISRGKLL